MARSAVAIAFAVLLIGCEGIEESTYSPDFPSSYPVMDDTQAVSSKDGQWIAFSRNVHSESGPRGVYLIRPSGNDEHLVMPWAEMPSWSPADSSLLAISLQNGQIYSYDLQTSQGRQVTDRSIQYLTPSWNAQGDSILFATRIGMEEVRGLWLFHPESNTYRHLLVGFAGCTRFGWGSYYAVYQEGESRIAALEGTEGRPVQLVTASELGEGQVRWPSLDSTGTRLLFSTYPTDENSYRIWVKDLESGSTELLLEGAAFPSWCSDGTSVLYTKWISPEADSIGNGRIWMLNLDSGVTRQVTGANN